MTMIDYKNTIDRIYTYYNSEYISICRARIYIIVLHSNKLISKSCMNELHQYNIDKFNDYVKGLS